MLGISVDVYETLPTLTLHVSFFEFLVDLFLFITVLFRAWLSLPVICYLMRYY